MYSGWLFSSHPVKLSCVVARHQPLDCLDHPAEYRNCNQPVPTRRVDIPEDDIGCTNRGRVSGLWTSQSCSCHPRSPQTCQSKCPCRLPSASIPGWPCYNAHYPTARVPSTMVSEIGFLPEKLRLTVAEWQMPKWSKFSSRVQQVLATGLS